LPPYSTTLNIFAESAGVRLGYRSGLRPFGLPSSCLRRTKTLSPPLLRTPGVRVRVHSSAIPARSPFIALPPFIRCPSFGAINIGSLGRRVSTTGTLFRCWCDHVALFSVVSSFFFPTAGIFPRFFYNDRAQRRDLCRCPLS